jgi:hypothetical protein
LFNVSVADDPPVAEKIFLSLQKVANGNPRVHCIAVSHSDKDSTDRWLESVGGAQNVEIIVDDGRKMYAAYGLGTSSWWHVLSPWSMSSVFKLGREEGIWNRPTESGSRWQSAGLFAVNADGTVVYAHPAKQADDMGDLDEALMSLSIPAKL